MSNGIKTRFTRYSFYWFARILIGVVLFAVFLFSIAMDNGLFITVAVIVEVAYIMVSLFSSLNIMEKTAAKIHKTGFNVDWWCSDGDSYLMIDTKIGRIAAVWAKNPFETQVIDASLITDAQVTLGMGLKNKKSTNKIGVKYSIGDKQYFVYVYRMSKSGVALSSELGQDYLKQARSICEMLLKAKDAALQNTKELEYNITLGRFLTYDEVSQVNFLLNGKRKVEAIKFVRETTKSGLAEAKQIVDDWDILYHRITKIYSTLYSSYEFT